MKIAPGIRALLLAMLFVLTRSAVSAQTLPSPWATTNIGSPRVAGSATQSSGTFTITASGSDIWGTSDQFRFVYQPVTGDVEIVARVVSVTQAHRWSKAGVMIRESLTAQSTHAMMVGSAGAGFAFQRRVQTGGSSDSTAGPANAPPGWVRLVRKGDLFSAYHSTDGVNWRLVGSDTIPMADTVYVGLPATSHSATVTTTAKLDSVKVVSATNPTNKPPAISITTPAANSQFAMPASFAISATATDPENAMVSVDFYANQTLISRDTSAPYSATFTTSTAGGYSLTAVAHDADGNSTTSGAIPITVQGAGNQAPAVTMTSPANGATFAAPATINLAATASDAEGPIARVEFYSGTTLLWTEVATPFGDSGPWTNVAQGTYTLTAVAYDGQGAKTTSAPVTVTVTGPNRPPSVTLTGPAAGATFTAPATINFAANASDPENQLSRVEFYSGTTLRGTDTTAPYTFSWSNVSAGTYSLTAKAFDAAGNQATSAAIAVTVTGPNGAPTVALTSPAPGTSITAPATISLTATASDPENQLTKVEFLNGTTVLATDTTGPYTWTWSNVAAGTYSLTAKAYDSAGAIATSSAVTVTVGNTTTTTPPRYVVFTASADHATNVTSYLFKVFAAGANPTTATPITSSDLGKPTPAANNDITVDRGSLFTALAPGSYIGTVTAIGPGGQTQGAPVTFTR